MTPDEIKRLRVIGESEAADRIEALEAHILKNSETEARTIADALAAQSRAEQRLSKAREALREVAEIVPEPLGDEGCKCRSCESLRRIATIATKGQADVE